MTGYYTITDTLKTALLEDDNVNTVTKGKPSELDISKQIMFPLSHLYVPNVAHEGATLRFSIELMLVDIEDISSVQTADIFRGNSNTDDIHNTQLAVGVRLMERLRRGDLWTEDYRIDGDPNFEDITEEFENGLTGWRVSFDVIYAHDMNACNPIVASYVQSYKSAKVLKTGQTTSYRTGDDGDLEKGRTTDFFTLPYNNPFSNTNRFTDELGGQDYTVGVVIDWTTYEGGEVLGYCKDINSNGTSDWNDAIDYGLAFSIGTFTSGWRIPSARELNNLNNYETGSQHLNYTPFNFSSSVDLWTSTTRESNTANAYTLRNGIGDIRGFAKTIATKYNIPCRDFTVTGTTLT